MSRRIYLASSWRNTRQPNVVSVLRADGHEVYDFRNPADGNAGFHWSEVDGAWEAWTPERFRDCLDHPIARRGFALDFSAMEWADTGVLLLPCGRSAHLEAGYFAGAAKDLFVLLAPSEPELMYRMATSLCVDLDELLDALAEPVGARREAEVVA